ncbi:Holliday junction branch migration protein RuvA [Metamycoplasma alkalescens]|uniref:Holliday junction branch migration complex subunit RuvA n=4 Tax=Metamycoplasma alkalescens TaxID=45363 RepID=N9UBT1_9BACT|nr:Holliday junction branch migration protein RuvA [Metamycoplasma alkalescens]ENY54156.1 Holliday junction DNA helicase ruvA [Metamycoplasma alkalescens 14918]PYF43177.1 Holliday junction DNA helicase RuvA [Metamycoplasma alkalescens]
MTIYLYGKIVHVSTNYLILDHNGMGELIYVPQIDRFKVGDIKKIFISQIINEYNKVTYGFENFKEMVIFEDLITLQGLGPKTAISILNVGWENIINFIANSKKEELTKIPYVSSKIANAILLSFKDKYAKFLSKINAEELEKFNKVIKENSYLKEFEETMKMLGFKTSQIKLALDHIELTNNIEECVENAIRIISQKQNETRIQS